MQLPASDSIRANYTGREFPLSAGLRPYLTQNYIPESHPTGRFPAASICKCSSPQLWQRLGRVSTRYTYVHRYATAWNSHSQCEQPASASARLCGESSISQTLKGQTFTGREFPLSAGLRPYFTQNYVPELPRLSNSHACAKAKHVEPHPWRTNTRTLSDKHSSSPEQNGRRMGEAF